MDNQFNFNVENVSINEPQIIMGEKCPFGERIPYGFSPETFEEKKQVKRVAKIIGGALLIMLGVSGVVGGFLGILLGMFGKVGTELLSDSAFLQVLQIVLSSLMFTVPFILIFRASKYKISSLILFKKPKKKDIIPYTLLGVAFCAFSNITVSLMGNFFSSFGVEYEVNTGENPTGIFGFMLTFIATAIIPPLVEEFACRGLILGALRKFGDGFAVLVSAFLFGIMHGNFGQIPFAFLVGLVLGLVTVKTNSIWLAVVIHAINNAVSVILDYAFTGISVETQNVIYTAYLIISLLLGLVAIYLLKGRTRAYTFKKDSVASDKRALYKFFFLSPMIIIFIIICLAESVMFFF